MATQEIDITKLSEAVGASLNNSIGLIAAELAKVPIEQAPVRTGRLVKSIHVNDGNNPKFTDTYRSKEIEESPGAIKDSQVTLIEGEVNRRNTRRGKNKKGAVWHITAAAPYSSYVHEGVPVPKKQSGPPRNTGQGLNFFTITPAKLSKAARIAASKNLKEKVKV